MDENFVDQNSEDNDDLLLDEELVLDPGMEAFETTLDRFITVASVEAVYGEPIQQENTLIIPAAEACAVMGFGVGSGTGMDVKGSSGNGSGGGGGGWSLSRPVAVIIASPGGVRGEPVIDVTKIAVAALTTAGFMLSLIVRMMRPRR